MDVFLVTAGAACMLAAIVGGGLKAWGIEFRPLTHRGQYVGVFLFGLVFFGLGLLLNLRQSPAPPHGPAAEKPPGTHAPVEGSIPGEQGGASAGSGSSTVHESGGRVTNPLIVTFRDTIPSALHIDQPTIQDNSIDGEVYFEKDVDGIPSIKFYIQPGSVNVSDATSSKEACLKAIGDGPTWGPLRNIYQGLKFCAKSPSGVALLTVTQAPDSNGIMRLSERYWAIT